MNQLRRLARDPLLLALIIIILGALGLFVVYPLVKVVLTSFQTRAGQFTLENYELFVNRRLYQTALKNSLMVGGVVAVISVLLGYVLAFVTTRLRTPGQAALNMVTMLPIISPPFVSAVSILFLFGFNGLITKGLLQLQDFSIYGFGGVVLSQVFTFTPIAYLSLRGVLQSINPTLEDAALNVGATKWQAFRRVTLPLSLPGIASALLIVFIESLADFGNPLVLAGATFPMLAPQAYLEITGSFNLPRGAALAVVLLIPSLTAFAIQRYWISRRQYITVTGKPTSSTSKLVSEPVKWALFGVSWLFAALVLAFYAVILVGAFTRVWGFDYTVTLQHFRYVFDVGFNSVKDTLVVAAFVTPLSGLLGMMIAFLVVRRRFPGRQLMEFTSILNFAVPGTVVGIGGVSRLPEAVLRRLPAPGGSTQRLAGPDRYSTATLVARRAFPSGVSRIYIASGTDLGGAVASGALGSAPVLLTPPCAAPPSAVAAEVRRQRPREIVLLGDTAVICPSVATALSRLR